MWFAIAAILMLFMGLTSAYVMRRGLDPQWQPIALPNIALINTALLLASSVTLELGRKWAARVLALAFVVGQLLLWRQLAAAGFYLSTNAHASFVFVLTGLHGVHLLGGVVALNWANGTRCAAVRLYWHFLAGLWVYLMSVLFAWR
jgi:cytochrome c oxidase subunit 3